MKIKIKKYVFISCILLLLYILITYIYNNYNVNNLEYSINGKVINNTLIITHNAGFFSCCSVKLDNIINYFNTYKELPEVVDSSKQFKLYKNHKNDDITYDYFKDYNNNYINIKWNTNIEYNHTYQYTDYKKLDYKNINPFINKYFSPSLEVTTIIKNIEDKYFITDYDNICVIFYRGNDKNTETVICRYESIISKAKIIFNNNKDIKFLIQSDETNFIDTLLNKFPSNSFYFKDEIRHINNQSSSVDVVYKDLNFEFSKKYLAITIIMSKCKYIICSSGNCSIWIMFYRGNSNNVLQYLNDKWL